MAADQLEVKMPRVTVAYPHLKEKRRLKRLRMRDKAFTLLVQLHRPMTLTFIKLGSSMRTSMAAMLALGKINALSNS